MRPATIHAPSAPAQKPPPGRSAPEAPAGPFAAILDEHKARTAVAEGHTEKRPTGAERDVPRAAAHGRDRAAHEHGRGCGRGATSVGGSVSAPATPASDPQAGAPATDPATAVVDVPAPAADTPPVTPAPAPAPTTPEATDADAGADSDAAVQPPVAGPAPDAPAVDAAPPAPPAFAPPAPPPFEPLVPGAAVAGDTTPATPPAAAAGGSVSATPPAATGAEAPHADGPDADDLTPTGPAAHHTADGAAQAGSPAPHGHGTDADADARRRPDGDGPRTASPAAPATAPAPAASPAPAGPASGAAVGPAPTATVGTPSAPAAPAAPPSSAGVPLAQAVETIRLTVSAARERGITRARIALAPAELGGIEVHLRHSAEGLSARLVAEAPEAAQLLSQAAGDLRRTFEQQGLTLVRIDIATAGDDRTGAGAAGHERREGRRPSGEPAPAAAATTDTPLVDHTIELGNGAIVDVLA